MVLADKLRVTCMDTKNLAEELAAARIADPGMEHRAQVVERDLLGEKRPLVTVVYNHEMNRVASVWLDGRRLERVIEVHESHGANGSPVVTIKMYAELKTEVKNG